MINEKFVMSFSGGKDSILALYRMIKLGYIPVALLTTIKKEEGKSWTHGLTKGLLLKVSESLSIPLITVECNVSEYETKFEEALHKAKELGATICAYGDIDIQEHMNWDIDRCTSVGIKAKFPLWKENREKLVYEFIDTGFTTVIKTVNLKYLDHKFLGKKLTEELVLKIKETDADICGENGEYHTFVIDGPIFKSPITFTEKGKVVDNGYAHLIIE